ncbi:hypothetical protein AcV7_009073 [Taiwanofungus camphoratus]|nr:hypothetical protein AcV7_009073 [Antrodia cinnamomea]
MRSSTLFGFSLLSLLLPFATADRHGHANMRRHDALAHRPRGDLARRQSYSSARFTFYSVGLGACGQTNQPSDFIVALDTSLYGSGYPGPNCFKSITIQANGKTTTATIMDECPGCPYGGLDFSEGLFTFFADPSVGVLYGTWWYNDGGSGGGDTTSSTWEAPSTTWSPTPTSTWSPPPPPPTTTWSPSPTTSWTPQWTPTTTWSPSSSWEPPSSSWEPSSSSWSSPAWSSSSVWSSPAWSSSSVWSSSAWSSSSAVPSSSASAEPALATGNATDPETLDTMNQVVVGMAALMVAGAQAQ